MQPRLMSLQRAAGGGHRTGVEETTGRKPDSGSRISNQEYFKEQGGAQLSGFYLLIQHDHGLNCVALLSEHSITKCTFLL